MEALLLVGMGRESSLETLKNPGLWSPLSLRISVRQIENYSFSLLYSLLYTRIHNFLILAFHLISILIIKVKSKDCRCVLLCLGRGGHFLPPLSTGSSAAGLFHRRPGWCARVWGLGSLWTCSADNTGALASYTEFFRGHYVEEFFFLNQRRKAMHCIFMNKSKSEMELEGKLN